MHDERLHTSHSKLEQMATLTLLRGEDFCIAEAVKNGTTRLYIKKGNNSPAPTYTEHPSGLSPDSVTIEQWEMTDNENVETTSIYLHDGNGLVLDCLVGGRPAKAKKK